MAFILRQLKKAKKQKTSKNTRRSFADQEWSHPQGMVGPHIRNITKFKVLCQVRFPQAHP